MSAPAGPMTEIAIIVHYQAMAGKGDQVAGLLGRHTAATRAEAGCRDFVALRGTEDPDSFVLYERYDSREAFEAHQASPHFEGIAVAQIRPLLRSGGWSSARSSSLGTDRDRGLRRRGHAPKRELTELITPRPGARRWPGCSACPGSTVRCRCSGTGCICWTGRRRPSLGADGHPVRDAIPMPPGPGLRRMFAGGRVSQHGPLRTGAEATRRTWQASSALKQGRSGPLHFVTVRTEISQGGQVVITEEQDLVYRGAAPPRRSAAGPGRRPRTAAAAAGRRPRTGRSRWTRSCCSGSPR